ncbi:MAG: AraC family transcriptional regulator [Pseudoflavonifractor sp.]
MAARMELIWTFMLDYAHGWGFYGHTHDYYQMYFAVAGEASILVDGHPFPLARGTCLIIRPGQVHELPVLRGGSLRMIDTKFRILDRELENELLALPQSTVIVSDEFRALQRGLRDEWSSNQPHSKEMAVLMLEQLFYLYLRRHNQGIMQLPFYRNVDDTLSRLTGPAREVTNYLADHFLEPLPLDELAATLRYNKNYLCKLFKDATGFTIVGYLNFLRITKAYDLVRYSDQKISDIGTACGFSSVHYFCRVFHKMTGQTPSEVQDKDRSALSTDMQLYGQFKFRYYGGDTLG